MTRREMLEEFAEQPVSWRAARAAEAIYADLGASPEQRCEILGLAIWPAWDPPRG
jgi:hypothetical protein